MLSYVLFVNAPVSSQAHYTAWRFADAVLEAGHQLRGVFFFGDAVAIANRFRDTASDEFDPQKKWQDLDKQYAIELLICSSSAQREGIRESLDASEPATLAAHYQIAGLGSFIELSLHADRVIQFGPST